MSLQNRQRRRREGAVRPVGADVERRRLLRRPALPRERVEEHARRVDRGLLEGPPTRRTPDARVRLGEFGSNHLGGVLDERPPPRRRRPSSREVAAVGGLDPRRRRRSPLCFILLGGGSFPLLLLGGGARTVRRGAAEARARRRAGRLDALHRRGARRARRRTLRLDPPRDRTVRPPGRAVARRRRRRGGRRSLGGVVRRARRRRRRAAGDARRRRRGAGRRRRLSEVLEIRRVRSRLRSSRLGASRSDFARTERRRRGARRRRSPARGRTTASGYRRRFVRVRFLRDAGGGELRARRRGEKRRRRAARLLPLERSPRRLAFATLALASAHGLAVHGTPPVRGKPARRGVGGVAPDGVGVRRRAKFYFFSSRSRTRSSRRESLPRRAQRLAPPHGARRVRRVSVRGAAPRRAAIRLGARRGGERRRRRGGGVSPSASRRPRRRTRRGGGEEHEDRFRARRLRRLSDRYRARRLRRLSDRYRARLRRRRRRRRSRGARARRRPRRRARRGVEPVPPSCRRARRLPPRLRGLGFRRVPSGGGDASAIGSDASRRRRAPKGLRGPRRDPRARRVSAVRGGFERRGASRLGFAS